MQNILTSFVSYLVLFPNIFLNTVALVEQTDIASVPVIYALVALIVFTRDVLSNVLLDMRNEMICKSQCKSFL